MSLIIETKNLSRQYQTYQKPEGFLNSIKGFWERKYTQKIALHPIDLQIESGQIIGLVGSNGAGKTTLLKLLSGLIYPSSGEARILGYNPWDRDPKFLKQMSILLGQKNQLWWDLPPSDSFQMLGEIYELDPKKTKARAIELSEMLKCRDQLNVQLRRLSLGERMKMEIIGALLHEPKVLFLDEPTIGLDIVAQNIIREFLASYVKDQKPTIILTSHYMDDISQLADRLLLISKGSLVYDGSVGQFMSQTELKQKLNLTLSSPLERDLQFQETTFTQGSLQITYETSAEHMGEFLNWITNISGIKAIQIEETDFEDVIHTFLEKGSISR